MTIDSPTIFKEKSRSDERLFSLIAKKTATIKPVPSSWVYDVIEIFKL